MEIAGDLILTKDLNIARKIGITPSDVIQISGSSIISELLPSYIRIEILNANQDITLPDPLLSSLGQQLEIEIIPISIYSALIQVAGTTLIDVFELKPNTVASFLFNGTAWILKSAGGNGELATYRTLLNNNATIVVPQLSLDSNKIIGALVSAMVIRTSSTEKRRGIFDLSIMWDEDTDQWLLNQVGYQFFQGPPMDVSFFGTTMGRLLQVNYITQNMPGAYDPALSYMRFSMTIYRV